MNKNSQMLSLKICDQFNFLLTKINIPIKTSTRKIFLSIGLPSSILSGDLFEILKPIQREIILELKIDSQIKGIHRALEISDPCLISILKMQKIKRIQNNNANWDGIIFDVL